MAKTPITREKIQKGFQDYLLEEGKAPESVRIFTKHLKISDDEFFQHFGSLRNIESSIWNDFFTKTLDIVHKDPEFEEMSSREKHLSFLFTFAELIKSHRSYILFRLEGKSAASVPGFIQDTQKIITQADIYWASPFEFIPDRAKDLTQNAYRRVLWQHSIATVLFWVKDDSPGAKDTDVFIEKSTRTAFDIGELPALNSIVDLSKFFLQKMGYSKTAI